jgi:hypothetical protein
LSTDVSEVRAASIIKAMMEAARTSETSVNNYFTREYIPEDKYEYRYIVCPIHLHAILGVGNFTKVVRMCADRL